MLSLLHCFQVCNGHGSAGQQVAFRVSQSVPKFILEGQAPCCYIYTILYTSRYAERYIHKPYHSCLHIIEIESV